MLGVLSWGMELSVWAEFGVRRAASWLNFRDAGRAACGRKF